jgi:hypothetical protein
MDVLICADFVNLYVLLPTRRPGVQLLALFGNEILVMKVEKKRGTKNGRRK